MSERRTHRSCGTTFTNARFEERHERHRLVREEALAAMVPEGGYADEDF
jgi:hypothetical protein